MARIARAFHGRVFSRARTSGGLANSHENKLLPPSQPCSNFRLSQIFADRLLDTYFRNATTYRPIPHPKYSGMFFLRICSRTASERVRTLAGRPCSIDLCYTIVGSARLDVAALAPPMLSATLRALI